MKSALSKVTREGMLFVVVVGRGSGERPSSSSKVVSLYRFSLSACSGGRWSCVQKPLARVAG
jgi:hypothetical protein